MITKSLVYSLMLAIVLTKSLAHPTSAGSDVIEGSKLMKRMEQPSNLALHASDCLCLDCFAQRMDLAPIHLTTPGECINQSSFLSTFCLPLPSNADLETRVKWEENNINGARLREANKLHKAWLKEMNIDPSRVKPTFRGLEERAPRSQRQGEGSSSSAMSAPSFDDSMERGSEQSKGPKVSRRRPGN